MESFEIDFVKPDKSSLQKLYIGIQEGLPFTQLIFYQTRYFFERRIPQTLIISLIRNIFSKTRK